MAAATGSDINATSSPRDSFTGVAARSVPVTRAHAVLLPTPPNSISPALPPHGLKAQLEKAAKLEPVDSDLDLQDVGEHNGCFQGGQQRDLAATHCAGDGIAALTAAAASSAAVGSPPYESADTITPAMLAKYHLPDILLNHGPLAIRYIIGYLTASVPGFSFIPPAKSRRLVVAALEGRGGNGGEGGGRGGLRGDVEFQKVSWGVWGARRTGSGRLSARGTPPPSSSSASSRLGIPIGGSDSEADATLAARNGLDRLRLNDRRLSSFDRDDERETMSMTENEVDKMSMDDDDGAASASCSEAPDAEDMVMKTDDPEDLTDDEDWGAVGAAALRATSYSNSATAGQYSSPSFLSARSYTSISNFAGGGRRSFSNFSAVLAPKPASVVTRSPSVFQPASNQQEREAVEALLRLGSV